MKVSDKMKQMEAKTERNRAKKIFFAVLFCGGVARIFVIASSFFPLFMKNDVFVVMIK